MTQFDHHEYNRHPSTVHASEQMWARAQEGFDQIVAYIKSEEAGIYEFAGNTDASVLFDYMKNYIIQAEVEHGSGAHLATILWCAVAITRLVRAPRTEQDDPLAQLEKEIGEQS